MFGSLSYMLATLKVFKLVRTNMNDSERLSYLIKKILFIISIASTVGLIIFFLKHRFLCHDLGKLTSNNQLSNNLCFYSIIHAMTV